ncbi:DUF1002 domain-containing protein [Bacillaceae bacterium]
MRKWLMTLFILLFSASAALADAVPGDTVITLGKDLTEAQKLQLLDKFNAPDAQTIYVTNEEEHRYLDGLLNKNLIGTRAISSAMIRIEEQGAGIRVETNNITWVSKEMYENALSTAGVTDAYVKVDAPFPVSGTAALTGIMKAFETVTGEKLDETRKKIANEEMVTTAQLAEKIGDKEKAAELLTRLKAELAKQSENLTDDQLRQLIQTVAAEMGLNLSDAEIDALISILKKIQALNIDWNSVLNQISSYKDEIETFLNNNPEAKSLLQEVLAFIKNLIDKALSWLQG